MIRLAGDASFRREKAILPTMLDGLFPQREAAKETGDAVASQAIKILMNSFYGVLGTSGCRFHNVAIANAITGTGRRFLLWSQEWFEQHGFEVLYGDTDSVFVRSGLDTSEARTLGPELAADLNEALAEHVQTEWQVDQPPDDGVREALREALPAHHARRQRRGPQALCRARG